MYNTDLPNRAELPGTSQLLRSTAVAVLIAAGLLITTVLPAEYGIDPTGVGRVLGLTRMGEIKVSLASEANAAEVPSATAAAVVTPLEPAVQSVEPAVTAAKEPAASQQHTMTVKLKPGQGAEIKLAMDKDARVRYEWRSAGGPVNYDTHGDPIKAPKGFYHGYGKGKGETADAGTLQAAFDGQHGWFWRNRTATDVTITLQTSGDYAKIERVI
jgi:hypothetical protein